MGPRGWTEHLVTPQAVPAEWGQPWSWPHPRSQRSTRLRAAHTHQLCSSGKLLPRHTQHTNGLSHSSSFKLLW